MGNFVWRTPHKAAWNTLKTGLVGSFLQILPISASPSQELDLKNSPTFSLFFTSIPANECVQFVCLFVCLLIYCLILSLCLILGGPRTKSLAFNGTSLLYLWLEAQRLRTGFTSPTEPERGEKKMELSEWIGETSGNILVSYRNLWNP